jgi:hypothetical protein
VTFTNTKKEIQMIRLSKSVGSLGAVALVAGVFTLTVPRAAHAVAAALVQVTNTSANPVLNQDVDALGRHPFMSSCSAQNICFFSAVPANRELVIQTISVGITIPPTSPPAIAQLQTTTGGTVGYPAQFPVVSTIEGFGSALQSITAYADPGTTPACTYLTTPALVNQNVACTISGYTVSLP